jgi:hypothetical protein
MGDRNPVPPNRRYRIAIIAVLAVVAVTLVAGAVAPVFSGDRGGDQPPRIDQPATNGSGTASTAVPDIPFGPLYVVVLVLCAIGIATQFSQDPWGTLKLALGVLGLVGVAWAILRVLMERDVTPPERNQTFGDTFGTPRPPRNGTTGVGDGTATAFSWPVDGLAAVAIGAVLVAVLAVVARRSATVRSALGLGGSESDDAGLDRDTIGDVAGAAADEVETAPTPSAADNAIYRTWSDMVALLDAPDPQSGTPRQFEAAAVDRGMDPDDVATLTRTFEAVRYGDATLSEQRRERAVAALRRIERNHDGQEQTAVEADDIQFRERDGPTDENDREGSE